MSVAVCVGRQRSVPNGPGIGDVCPFIKLRGGPVGEVRAEHDSDGRDERQLEKEVRTCGRSAPKETTGTRGPDAARRHEWADARQRDRTLTVWMSAIAAPCTVRTVQATVRAVPARPRAHGGSAFEDSRPAACPGGAHRPPHL